VNGSRFLVALLLVMSGCTAATVPPPSPVAPPTPPPAPPTLACGEHFTRGRVISSTPTTFLCRAGYAVLHSATRRTPLLVAQRLEPSGFDGTASRTDDFRPDLELPAGERSELADYRSSGYDRGHMAPSADFSSSAERVSESFLLSNVVPQDGTLNSGWWASLESATRACARSEGMVWVLTGPIFADPVASIGANRVGVPSSLFKVIVNSSGSSRAYVIANAAPALKGFRAYQVTVSRVEDATGLELFPQGGVIEDTLGTLCAGAFGG
jgi:endonuclease G